MSYRKHPPLKKGDRFGKWTVLEFSKRDRDGHEIWFCQCECGAIKEVLRKNLVKGSSKACKACGRTQHGHKKNGLISNTYQSWCDMKKRCHDPKNRQYKDYGGRGIKICDRWLKFENFLEDMGECPPRMTLERINNNDGYYKENCKWATHLEQNNNQRSNYSIEFEEETLTLTQYRKKVGLPSSTFYNRLYRGWSLEEALGLTT